MSFRLQMRLICSSLSLVLISSVANGGKLKCEHISPIMELMLKQHLVHTKFNSNLETRTVDQYIKILDGAKLYLLESDVKEIKKKLDGFSKNFAKQDCSSLEAIQTLYRNRVEERSNFVEKYLSNKELKFDPTIKLALDSEKREYPKALKDAEEFTQKYAQWQLATLIASDMKMDEGKAQITRRYQRAVKTTKDQKIEEAYSNILDAFARSLDPHSNFLSSEDREDFEIQMKLSLEGIGATLSSQDGYTVIEQLVPGGAAFQSGQVQTQDKITAVGQGDDGQLEPIIDMPLRDVVRQIRGPKGSKVRLSILRKKGDKTETFAVTLTRQKINLEQDAAQISYVEKTINGEKKTIGVINLPSFYLDTSRGGRSCYEDMKKLLIEAKTKKVSAMVLDLSSNGGGSLEDAVKLSGLFLGTGHIVKTRGRDEPKKSLRNLVMSRGRSEDNTDVLSDEDESVQYNGPLVILTSRLSASASEIVAGALRDYRRAIIVGGDHTFGKGSVQQVVPLPEGLGAFKVTIGMFFVPGGSSTQHRGVQADIVLPGAFATEEIGEKSLDYSLPPQSIAPFLSKTAYVTKGENSWAQIDNDTISKLNKASKTRVATNTEFQKIVKELKEAQTKNKTVVLQDIVKKKDEVVSREEKRKKEAADPKLKQEEYLKRPDLQEAIQVVTDWLTGGSVSVKTVEKAAAPTEKQQTVE